MHGLAWSTPTGVGIKKIIFFPFFAFSSTLAQASPQIEYQRRLYSFLGVSVVVMAAIPDNMTAANTKAETKAYHWSLCFYFENIL
ncbi:MAG: hypothetical protein R2822_16975 [Spirosomataceae bacterium]